MQDLSTLRTRWLRAMTIAESLRICAMLMRLTRRVFAQRSKRTWPNVRPLIERQRRLVRPAQWLKEHPEDNLRF